MLPFYQHFQRQRLGTFGNRKNMIEVAQYPLLTTIRLGGHTHLDKLQLSSSQHLADTSTQNRHQNWLVYLNIEPIRILGFEATF